jgi:pilus assembly protein Flp/PilA
MNAILKLATQSVRSFVQDDEGAQVVEYALIIAVVSLVLVVALKGLTGTSFSGFITRVGTCLTTPASCVAS